MSWRGTLGSLLLLSLGGAVLVADRLEVGATRADVYRELGAPASMLELPSRTVLVYPSAEVTLVDGRLTEAVWKCPETMAMEREHQAQVREQQVAWEQARAEERHQRGERILGMRRVDPGFLNRPPQERARLWAEFMRDYPSIDAMSEYETALSEARTAYERERVRLAETPAPPPLVASRGLIDTVSIGSGYGMGYYPPAPSTTVVIGGGPGYAYCPPSLSKPILSVNYQGSKVGFQFQGGGGLPMPGRQSFAPPPRPVVIIQRQ